MGAVDLMERLYRFLLLAYPRRFRRQFGEDMVQLFRDRRREGPWRSHDWIGVWRDILWQALLERTQRQVRHRFGYAPASGRGPHLGDNRRKKDWKQMFDTTRQDIGYAFRTFVRNPTFTLIAVVTLALEIGANTAIFSVINGVVLQPLQFGDPDQLTVVWETSSLEGVEASETSVGTFLDWREKNQAFEDITAWTWDTFVLQEEDDSEVLDDEPRAEMYVVMGQVPRNILSFVVRTARDPNLMVDQIRREIAAHDPAQPAHSVVPLADLISETVAAEHFYALVLGVFAAVALALSAAGIYGVLSYWVNQRTSEIGLRIALGASGLGVVRLVVGHGMFFTILGVAIGIVGAFISTRVLSNVLYGVGVADPLTFVGVTAVLAGIALVACWLPAFRASRVDPVRALREE